MDSPTDRIRLAITSFEEPGLLSKALSELLKLGFAGAQLCLLGTQRRMRAVYASVAALQPPPPTEPLDELCGELVTVDSDLDGSADPIVATPGPLLDLIVADISGAERADLAPVSRARGSRLARADLDCAAGIVLVVLSSEPSQQLAATRVMLSGSHFGVTTHEFQPIGPAAARAAALAGRLARPLSF